MFRDAHLLLTLLIITTSCIRVNLMEKNVPEDNHDHGEEGEASLREMLPEDIINKALELAQEVSAEIKEDLASILDLIKKCVETCINIDDLSVRSGTFRFRMKNGNKTDDSLSQLIAKLPPNKQAIVAQKLMGIKELKNKREHLKKIAAGHGAMQKNHSESSEDHGKNSSLI